MPLAHLLDDRNTGYAPKQQFLHRVKTRPAAATTVICGYFAPLFQYFDVSQRHNAC